MPFLHIERYESIAHCGELLSATRGVLFVLKTPFFAKKIQKHEILPCNKLLFSLSVQNEEISYKNSWFRIFFVRNSSFWGYLRQTNLKVSEIVVLKYTQKGLPAPDSDASYNCGFSKGKWPSVSRHDGAAFTLPSMCTKSHASMAWLTRTSCSRCPCGSTTFQENLTVSAASMSGGAVLFCWVMKSIPII